LPTEAKQNSPRCATNTPDCCKRGEMDEQIRLTGYGYGDGYGNGDGDGNG